MAENCRLLFPGIIRKGLVQLSLRDEVCFEKGLHKDVVDIGSGTCGAIEFLTISLQQCHY